MPRSPLRSFVLALLVLFFLAGCGGGDDGDEGSASPPTTEAPADDDAFCDAAGAFGAAQDGAPDAETPEAVEETLDAMVSAADALVESAPPAVTEAAESFADAITGLQQYAADRDYEVDLGGAAPEYQSGEGAEVVDEITSTIGPVDQAVQDECDRFLTEAG